MEIQLWQILLAVFLWCMVFLLHALRFDSTELSEFELARRIKAGDADAQDILEREELLPRMRALRQIFETLFIVAAISVTNATLGLAVGLTAAVVLLLLLDTVSRMQFMNGLASKWYAPNEYLVLNAARDWKWLDLFRPYVSHRADAVVSSKDELIELVSRSRGVLSHDEKLRFDANLTLDDRTVRDVMTPVSVVDTISVSEKVGPLVLDDLHKTGHSRFPVIEDDVNHVVGILYLHELVDLKTAKKTVKEAMDSHVHYIHEEQTLEHALHAFLKTRRHLFIVVNEYRETVGVLALEDVIEALLGKKIVDEFDKFDDLRAVAASNPRNNNSPKKRIDV